jgi:hypothetical protein
MNPFNWFLSYLAAIGLMIDIFGAVVLVTAAIRIPWYRFAKLERARRDLTVPVARRITGNDAQRVTDVLQSYYDRLGQENGPWLRGEYDWNDIQKIQTAGGEIGPHKSTVTALTERQNGEEWPRF